MNCNGNRLSERGSAKIERIGNAIQTPRRRHHVFGESTVGVNAENPKTAANGVPARGAKAAFSARKKRFNDDPLTAGIAGYSFAYCLHLSARFVSENCPRRHFRRFGVQRVYVASAYSTGANTNQHLTRARRRYRSRLDNDVVGAGINTSVHHSLCHRTVPLRLERPLDAAWCLATDVSWFLAGRMRLLLIVHVFACGGALVLALPALFTAKGDKAHRRWGRFTSGAWPSSAPLRYSSSTVAVSGNLIGQVAFSPGKSHLPQLQKRLHVPWNRSGHYRLSPTLRPQPPSMRNSDPVTWAASSDAR